MPTDKPSAASRPAVEPGRTSIEELAPVVSDAILSLLTTADAVAPVKAPAISSATSCAVMAAPPVKVIVWSPPPSTASTSCHPFVTANGCETDPTTWPGVAALPIAASWRFVTASVVAPAPPGSRSKRTSTSTTEFVGSASTIAPTNHAWCKSCPGASCAARAATAARTWSS